MHPGSNFEGVGVRNRPLWDKSLVHRDLFRLDLNSQQS